MIAISTGDMAVSRKLLSITLNKLMRRSFNVLKLSAEGKLPSQLVSFRKDRHLRALDRAQLLTQTSQPAFEKFSLDFDLFLGTV